MTDYQGRSPEHQARNEQANEIIWIPIILFILAVGGFEIGGWLVSMVAGWLT